MPIDTALNGCATIQAKWLVEPLAGQQRMAGEQSRKSKAGDRVCWKTDHNDLGTITQLVWRVHQME
jgi:hypothetical protein